MLTLVQKRSEIGLNTTFLYAKPKKISDGNLGKIYYFESNKIFVYCITTKGKSKAFVIKTGPSNNAVIVPGIYPEVELLAEAKTKGKVTRLQNILEYIDRNNIKFCELSSMFFLRLNCLLDDRDFSYYKLKKVIDSEENFTTTGTY